MLVFTILMRNFKNVEPQNILKILYKKSVYIESRMFELCDSYKRGVYKKSISMQYNSKKSGFWAHP